MIIDRVAEEDNRQVLDKEEFSDSNKKRSISREGKGIQGIEC